ncbi:MAG: 30S ribosome-binding factor RbfA [Actinobacteria bacterium]|nr:30S ribosome-binding factor RbfA [Actinomycetota bacterium]
MADTARARKLADRIKVVVAETLEKRIKDPRLGFVTVTDARVTGDLQHASVFYTVYGDAAEQTASAAALESAKGVVRSEVGRRTGIRLTPTLEFIADAVPENAQHIDELLALAAARDAEVAALAAKAEYAGDPDPYKHDDLEEVDDALDAEDSADDDADDDADDEDDEDWDTDDDEDEADEPSGAVASADGTVTGS